MKRLTGFEKKRENEKVIVWGRFSGDGFAAGGLAWRCGIVDPNCLDTFLETLYVDK